MRVWTWLLATAVILSMVGQTVTAQKPGKAAAPGPDTSKTSLAVSVGYGTPRSKDALTQFWKGGPAFSMKLLVRSTRSLSFGVGGDVSALWFRLSKFAATYPSVEAHRKDMAWFDLFMFSRYTFATGMALRPYGEFSIGASRLSGAEYKEVVDSVRVTYYEIPARTRLALTFTGGLEIPVSGSFSFLAEANLRYVHNDPNVGVGLLFMGGARVRL